MGNGVGIVGRGGAVHLHNETRKLIITGILIFTLSLLVYSGFNLKDHFLLGDFKALRGDEPDYLIVTKSIIQDLDFQLENNYLNPGPEIDRANWTWHVREGVDGHLYSSHGVGLPIMAAPFYLVGGILGMKIFISGIMAAINLLMFLICYSLKRSYRSAVFCFVTLGFASPLLPMSSHLSSDVPMALFTCLAFFLLLRNNGGRFSYLVVGVLMGFAPFMKSLYAVLGLVTLIYILVYSYQRAHLRNSIYFILPYIILSTLYGYYQYAAFGSPFATPQKYAYSNLIDGSLGLLFDRRYGLLVYSPIFYFSFFGIYSFLREKRREALLGSSYFMSLFLIVASSPAWFGGWTLPARLIIPVIPLLIIPLYYFASTLPQNRFVRVVFYASAIISFLANGAILWFHAFSRNKFTQIPVLIMKKLTGIDMGFLVPVFTDQVQAASYLISILILVVTVVLVYVDYRIHPQ